MLSAAIELSSLDLSRMQSWVGCSFFDPGCWDCISFWWVLPQLHDGCGRQRRREESNQTAIYLYCLPCSVSQYHIYFQAKIWAFLGFLSELRCAESWCSWPWWWGALSWGGWQQLWCHLFLVGGKTVRPVVGVSLGKKNVKKLKNICTPQSILFYGEYLYA